MKPSVAIIGLGVMGHRMLTNMVTHGGFNLAWAWDPNPESCRIVEQRYPGIKIGDSAQQIITKPDVDIAYIASPPQSHREYASAAANAGKTVFCEKPLGTNLADSQALVTAVEATGVINAVNFPFADAQAVNMIQARLEDGTVGTVKGVDVRLHFSIWPRDWQQTATWLALRKEGGFVREVGSHYIFLLEKLFGPVTLIDASVHYPDDETLCETHFLARLDCQGIPVSIAGGSGGVGPDRVEFTVWGDKTSYRLWDWNKLLSSTGEDWNTELTHIKDPRQDGYRRVLDNFLALHNGAAHTMPQLRAALSVQDTVDQILMA